jgi:hypothetical protein
MEMRQARLAQLIDHQGWNDAALLGLFRKFIYEDSGRSLALLVYLERVADEENGAASGSDVGKRF